MNNLNYIEYKDILIPFDYDWKNISVSVSGGADSALLAYLLSKIIKEERLKTNIHFITNIRMWESRPWQRYDSLNVYNYIRETFPSITYFRHENYIPPELETSKIGKIIPHFTGERKGGDPICTFSYVNYICNRENINSWYAALTRNPEINLSNAPDDRNSKETDNVKNPVEIFNNIVISHPFCNKAKDWIIKQYKELDILDLLSMSRSCEGDKNSAPEIFESLDFYSYTPYQNVPTCGKCFWCQERNWALSQNNL